jgi:glycosyltransferase involved in cell wall biosynthesis
MISVVVPVYNEEKYIENCIKSLLQQEELPGEIIIVDNNCTDRTIEIAKKYPVRIVTERKQGMIHARNKGYDEAIHDIIAQTDADTQLPPDWTKKIQKLFMQHEDVVAVSGPCTFYEMPKGFQYTHRQVILLHELYFRIVGKILAHPCLFGPNKAIRKIIWEKVRREVCLSDRDVHEDVDLAIHIADFGSIVFDNKLVVKTSIRRFKKISTYFEYPYRLFKSIQIHNKFYLKSRSKRYMKLLLARISA